MKHRHGKNCPRCKEIRRRFQDQKRRYLRLVADLRMMLATTAYNRVRETIRERLDQEDTC